MEKRTFLQREYSELAKKYGIQIEKDTEGINYMVKELVSEFCEQCKKPAIWCNGIHTKSLMTDFMFEMRNVKYIVDKFQRASENSGFYIIAPTDVVINGIDGVIISTFRWRKEILDEIQRVCPDIKYLDIYEKLAENGFKLTGEYYAQGSPYTYYHKVNRLLRETLAPCSQEKLEELYWELAAGFFEKKDFRTAIVYAKKLCTLTKKEIYEEFIKDLEYIYRLELQIAADISQDNVLMCCIDGLRRKDVLDKMPAFKNHIDEKTFFYNNAFSTSTSTYESLIPAFSGYQHINDPGSSARSMPEEECLFICRAKEQGRKIYFYTDATPYIISDSIHVIKDTQTVTEKMWNFILDACDEQNGLFYIHILYESHFAFPNPYTAEELITFGSLIILEYLDVNGGKLRCDYRKQHDDAIRYIDDVFTPIFEKINCRTVVFADHGNLIPNKEKKLEEWGETEYTFHEDRVRIPMLIKSPEYGTGNDGHVASLGEINEILLALMEKRVYIRKDTEYVKCVRCPVYNQALRSLYTKMGQETSLEAYEMFEFQDGYKLGVFGNGEIRLYCCATEERIEDYDLKVRYYNKVKNDITVCGTDKLRLRRQGSVKQNERPKRNRSGLPTKAINIIKDTLRAADEDIRDIRVMKAGMTNRSFLFTCHGQKYVIRVPGEGTAQLIRRAEEEAVYHIIAGRGLCDDVTYINAENGYKITKYIEDARVCDPSDVRDVERCITKMRDFHEMELSVSHTFDLYSQILYYETLRQTASVYPDYEDVKDRIWSLQVFIDRIPKKKTLTHIDSVPDNFLFSGPGGGINLQLIDWEYAGMQDPHVDIAMFCIYAGYDKEQIDRVIDLYFNGQCSDTVRIKCYCYVAIGGLLWSNWCEYKKRMGVAFGSYAARQYEYAREYSAIADKYIKEKFVKSGTC